NGSYTTFNAANAFGTFATAIRSSSLAAGYFNDASGTHGFKYANGTLTTLNATGATATVATSIDTSGHVGGYFNDAGGTHGFLYKGGSFFTYDAPTAISTVVQAVTGTGLIAGYYTDATGQHAFETSVPFAKSVTAATDNSSLNLNAGHVVTITVQVSEAVNVV